ncbi:hypothetical protein AAF712_002515 [Marasmius tenuissimus]|uniref:Uncharacterized protein n=1 Tax=Marasmius tenuissimus TaxID=585030 RepID=A0ABR3A9R0_9AGAR
MQSSQMVRKTAIVSKPKKQHQRVERRATDSDGVTQTRSVTQNLNSRSPQTVAKAAAVSNPHKQHRTIGKRPANSLGATVVTSVSHELTVAPSLQTLSPADSVSNKRETKPKAGEELKNPKKTANSISTQFSSAPPQTTRSQKTLAKGEGKATWR